MSVGLPFTYQAEAEERWGGTEAYTESVRRTKAYTEDDWTTINGQQEAIQAGLAAAMAEGDAPEYVARAIRANAVRR